MRALVLAAAGAAACANATEPGTGDGAGPVDAPNPDDGSVADARVDAPTDAPIDAIDARPDAPIDAPLPTNCDPFTGVNGTTIPNWTERVGDWFLENGRIRNSVAGGVYQHVVTMNGSMQADGCGRVQAFHIGGPSIQAVGIVLRWSPPANYVVALVQDNVDAGNFNSIWIYQYPGVTGLGTSLTNQVFGTSPNLEACVSGSTVTMRVDANQDGVYEVSHSAQTTLSGSGLTGVMTHSFQSASNATPQADNFCWGPPAL